MSFFDAMSATAIGVRRDCKTTTGSGNDRKGMGVMGFVRMDSEVKVEVWEMSLRSEHRLDSC